MSGPINPNVSGDTPKVTTGTYQNGSVSVGTSATLLCNVPGGYGVVVYNAGAEAVYVGDSAVTTTTGIPVVASASVTIPSGTGLDRALYAVSGTAGQNVLFLFAD